MAEVVERKVVLKFSTSSGRERSITLNTEPTNPLTHTFDKPDDASPTWTAAVANTIRAVWADDDGASIVGEITPYVVTTTMVDDTPH